MLKYIVRRILFFIPTLIAIAIIAFIISASAPGDPVERLTEAPQSGEMNTNSGNQLLQKEYWTQKLGLDLPLFYISIHSLAMPDTLYKVYDKNERYALKRLADKYGDWECISKYYIELLHLDELNKNITIDSSYSKKNNEIKEAFNLATAEFISLRSSWDDLIINSKIENLKKVFSQYLFFKRNKAELNIIEKDYERIKDNSVSWKNYIPVISFYSNNWFHRWIFGDGNWLTGEGSVFSKGILRGDFGLSYITKEPIGEIISSRISWSLFFSFFSVILAYIISIPIGIRSAVRKNKAFDIVSSVILYLLFSIPVFWLGTLLIMTFSNPDLLWIFPATGVKPITGFPANAGLFEKMWLSIPYLVLPLICYIYSSIAFLSRTVRTSMLEVLPMDFIRTARAKGLPEKNVIYDHAFRNSLLPLITVFANVFPLAIGGSVIIETIFSIPGMGFEAYSAITNQDYPMIVAVFVVTGVFTLVGYFISDILYAVADPRIKFANNA
jgi:peptide/nickel transport system permease protein